MIKTNKNGFLKAAGLMLALTMLAACVVSGTLAKYVSEGSATDVKATAATWNINVSGTDIKTYAFDDLDFTISELTDGAKADSYEENVIVPGTFGYAEITVTNAGEVDAVLSITKGGTATSHQGLKFAILESAPNAQNASSMTDASLSDIELKHTGGSNTKTIYIAYCWEFDDNNEHADVDLQGTEINFGSIALKAEQAGGAA